MLKPADREAAEISIEQFEMGEHPVGQALGEGAVFAADELPVFGRAFLHFAKRRPAMSALGHSMLRLFGHIHLLSPMTDPSV